MIAVFTCDIIASRRFSALQRQVLDQGLRNAFAETCRILPGAKGELLSFSVVQGDEFQFSILQPAWFYSFLLMLRLRFSLLLPDGDPMFRCGIGIGTRSIAGGSSYQRDGSAYHASREALERFERMKGRLSILQRANGGYDAGLNLILGFCDHLELSWSSRQKQALLLRLEGHNLKQSAEQLHSSWQNVQQLLQNAGWDRLQEAIGYFNGLRYPPPRRER